MKYTDHQITFLAYHSILPAADDLLTLHPSSFRDQMSWLLNNGISLLSLQEAVTKIKEGKKTHPSVVLTFDDGYTNFLEYAAPILEEFKYSSTIFLVTGKMGKESDWNRLSKPHRLLDLEEILDLQQQGFHFGSHTVNHIVLTQAPFFQLQFELQNSLSFIKNILGESFLPFSYPHGLSTRREMNAVRNAGYNCACSTFASEMIDSEQIFNLPRIEIHNDLKLSQFGASVLNKFNLQLKIESIKVKFFSIIAKKRKPAANLPPHQK